MDRWAGIAKGVGVQKILGRIHMVQIQIEKDFLTTSFSILEEQPMDMLLGLDMLKRHQVCGMMEFFLLKMILFMQIFMGSTFVSASLDYRLTVIFFSFQCFFFIFEQNTKMNCH